MYWTWQTQGGAQRRAQQRTCEWPTNASFFAPDTASALSIWVGPSISAYSSIVWYQYSACVMDEMVVVVREYDTSADPWLLQMRGQGRGGGEGAAGTSAPHVMVMGEEREGKRTG